ncbi:MAG: DMT family transporter [Alphaproteobacteria bacterium]|nr:DMT family transporter [Alphaproteobacteria bacterium]
MKAGGVTCAIEALPAHPSGGPLFESSMVLGPPGQKPYLHAAGYMVLAALLFAVMVAGIRHTADLGIHPLEIVFFRNLFGFLVIGPVLWREGFSLLRTDRLMFFGLRTILGLASMFLWFQAVAMTPLSETVALSFMTPIFVTVLAIVLLRENAGAMRWAATLGGFAGVVLIVRPGFVDVTTGHIWLLISSVFNAASMIIIKILARTEPAERIVAFMTILFTPLALIPALFVWQWPNLEQLWWLAVLGGSGTLAHVMMTKAMGIADVAALMPLDFVRLVFATGIGIVAFAEYPDLWTLGGAIVIFASSVFIARDESKRDQKPPSGGPGS